MLWPKKLKRQGKGIEDRRWSAAGRAGLDDVVRADLPEEAP